MGKLYAAARPSRAWAVLCIVTKNHVWGVKVQNASSGKSIYSFKSSVRYFPEICILSSVLIAELTRLALPGQNDQFPWPEKNSVEPKRCDGKQWIFKGKIAFFLVFIMLAMEIM